MNLDDLGESQGFGEPWHHPVWNRFFALRVDESDRMWELLKRLREQLPPMDNGFAFHRWVGEYIAPINDLQVEWFAVAAELPWPEFLRSEDTAPGEEAP